MIFSICGRFVKVGKKMGNGISKSELTLPSVLVSFNDFFSSSLRYGEKSIDYAVRSNPHRRFVWNSHLLSRVEKDLHPDWILYVTHGFIGQSNVSIFGRSIYITLIARRSSKYAGTRFLKRGANFDVSRPLNDR